jgi:hypothetical protein
MKPTYTPPTEEQKTARRKSATHERRGILFQLSHEEEDMHPLAWWFNEGSGMWQWSEITNSEVRRFSEANV